MSNLVGLKPNQVPLVGDLGSLAFQNANSLQKLVADEIQVETFLTNNVMGEKPPVIDIDFVNSESPRYPNSLQTRASTATYMGKDGYLKTAAVNEMRIEYDAITHACKGLLMEREATNLMTYSQDFTNSNWTLFDATIANSQVLSPTGTNYAYKLIETSANVLHYIRQVFTKSNGLYHTGSVYAKAGERSVIQLVLSGYSTWEGYNSVDGTNPPEAFFDLSTGTATTFNSYAVATIEACGNGWYRCSITVKATATTASRLNVVLCTGMPTAYNDVTVSVYEGDGTSGAYLWGAQLELYNVATSYIRTKSSAATRAVDKYYVKGTSVSPYQWTLFAEYSFPYVGTLTNSTQNRNTLAIVNTSNETSNRFFLTNNSTLLSVLNTNGDFILTGVGTSTTNFFDSSTSTDEILKRYETLVKNTVYKQAMSVNPGGTSTYVDHRGRRAIMTGATSVNSALPNYVRLGCAGTDTNTLNGHIRKVRVYKVALTDNELLEMVS